MIDADTVYGALGAAAARWPDKPFLNVLPETAAVYGIDAGLITYGALKADVDRQIAAYRAAGVTAGMRLGVLVENRPVFYRHWFAMNALGASIVPINPDLRAAELEYLIGHSEMVAAIVLPARAADVAAAAQAAGRDIPVIGPDDALPELGCANIPPPCGEGGPNEVEDRVGVVVNASNDATKTGHPHPQPSPARGKGNAPGPDTECALLYTSGTTGRPKGCILTNTYFLNNGRWYCTIGGLVRIRPGEERMLTPLPLFHMNAMATSTMAMMMSGGCLTVLDRFHPRTWWDSVRAARATIVHYLGVMPPMLMGAAPTANDADNEVVFGFGAGVNKTLHGPFEARFGFPLVEAWAMTETGGGVIIAATTEPRHLGVACIGKADAETELRIIREDGSDCAVDEPGELLVRKTGAEPRAGFFKAYLKDEAATEEAWAGGYFHTGDVVRRDADGYIYFVDRRKNVIRRSGENIAAVEVESVLLQHPAIAACAVAATPDAVRGDEVFACIVPKAPVDDPQALAREIVTYALSRLAYYKAPGWVAFVDALPVTATQKIQRGEMKGLVERLVADPATIDTRAMKKRQ